MKTIEEKVDRAIATRSRPVTRNRIFRKTRLAGKISPVGLILLVSALAIGMLSGLLYTEFYVQVQSPIELTGKMVPVFLFDGQAFTGQYYNTSADITTLDAGQTVRVNHTITNDDNYAWELQIDDSFMDAFTSEPSDPFYGFNFSAIPNDWVFIPGETITVEFIYSLNHEFVGTDLPLAFNLKLNIIKTNAAPVTHNDTLRVVYGQTGDIDPTLNDEDYEDDTINIVAYDHPISGLTITQDGNVLHIKNEYGQAGETHVLVWVDVSDGVNPPVREYIDVACIL